MSFLIQLLNDVFPLLSHCWGGELWLDLPAVVSVRMGKLQQLLSPVSFCSLDQQIGFECLLGAGPFLRPRRDPSVLDGRTLTFNQDKELVSLDSVCFIHFISLPSSHEGFLRVKVKVRTRCLLSTCG